MSEDKSYGIWIGDVFLENIMTIDEDMVSDFEKSLNGLLTESDLIKSENKKVKKTKKNFKDVSYLKVVK